MKMKLKDQQIEKLSKQSKFLQLNMAHQEKEIANLKPHNHQNPIVPLNVNVTKYIMFPNKFSGIKEIKESE